MNNTRTVLGSNAVICGKNLTVLSSVDSTNNYIKEHSDLLPDGHVCISHEQLSGRGRQGKSFYSPNGEGLYMSLLIKNPDIANDSLFTARIPESPIPIMSPTWISFPSMEVSLTA